MSRSSTRQVLIMLGLALALALAPAAALADGNPNPRILPPGSAAYGRTYAQWSAAWWEYAFSVPTPQNPFLNFDASGARCANGQSGPVFFLVGSLIAPGTYTPDRCVVPAGKALFFPVLDIWEDQVDTAPNTPTVAQMRADNAAFIGAITDLHASIDGVAVQGLMPAASSPYRAISPTFSYSVPADNVLNALFDPSPPVPAGSIAPLAAVADGVYLMVAPLPPGPHIINLGGTFGDFTLDVTYHLTVAP